MLHADDFLSRHNVKTSFFSFNSLQLAACSTVHVTTYAKTFYPFTNATLTKHLSFHLIGLSTLRLKMFWHSAVTENHLPVACCKIFFISVGSQEKLKTLHSPGGVPRRLAGYWEKFSISNHQTCKYKYPWTLPVFYRSWLINLKVISFTLWLYL